jgi:hypothetical protein
MFSLGEYADVRSCVMALLLGLLLAGPGSILIAWAFLQVGPGLDRDGNEQRPRPPVPNG